MDAGTQCSASADIVTASLLRMRAGCQLMA